MAGEAGGLTPHEGDLEPDEEYDGLLFAGVSFDESAAGNCHFLDCAFVNVSFGDARLRKSRFTDTTMRDTRFVSSDLAETGWLDVTLTGCALAGVQVFSAALRRVRFRDCKLDSVNFRSGTLTDVTFENCLLRDTEFGGARLLRVISASPSPTEGTAVRPRAVGRGSAQSKPPSVRRNEFGLNLFACIKRNSETEHGPQVYYLDQGNIRINWLVCLV